MIRNHQTTLWLAALLLALSTWVGCVAEQPGDVDTLDGAPAPTPPEEFGAPEGAACGTSRDCAIGLRCLRHGAEQFCAQPCTQDAECATRLCNPLPNSDQGWCELTGGQAPPPGGQAPDPQNPPQDDEEDDGGAPQPQPGDPAPEPDDEPPPPQQTAAQPGNRCDCDTDCADVDGYDGICVQGICMLRASGTCARQGSSQECPSGARCWSGRGLSICYPDCGGFPDCDGTCDGDNSCVATNGMDCYDSCGQVCSLPGGPGGDVEPDPGPNDPPDPNVPQGDCGSEVESQAFALLNQDRTSRGLSALACDLALVEVARAHSQDMAQRGFFSHTNPEGEQPWDRMRRAGISFRTAGENIAYGYATPQAVEEGWMNSPGHRANILSNNYSHVGVGAYNHQGTWYWTQVFAAF